MLPVQVKLQRLWTDRGSWAERRRPASGAADLHPLLGNAALQPNREGARVGRRARVLLQWCLWQVPVFLKIFGRAGAGWGAGGMPQVSGTSWHIGIKLGNASLQNEKKKILGKQ